jgi:hypothetical protein
MLAGLKHCARKLLALAKKHFCKNHVAPQSNAGTLVTIIFLAGRSSVNRSKMHLEKTVSAA